MKITGIAFFCTLTVGLASASYPRAGLCGLFNLQTIYQWSTLQYAGNTDSSTVSYSNSYITGIEDYNGTFFVATPRSRGYNPATLSTIPCNASVAGTTSPVLQPYPDMSWHQLQTNYQITKHCANDCNHTLVSVHRTDIDGCNRLWVLDSGTVNGAESPRRVCDAKIVVFDLTTNQMVKLILIPKDVLEPNSVLTSIVLDNVGVSSSSNGNNQATSNCDNGFIYIADTTNPGLIVYNQQSGNFYRIVSAYMYPDPCYPAHQLNGQTFTSFYGIDGIAVSGSGNSRNLYFQPFASRSIYSIPTSFLQAGPYNGDWSQIPVTRVVSKQSGSVGLITDPLSGCLLFNPVSQNSINSYSTQFNTQRTVASSQTLAVVNDFAVNCQNINQKYAVSVNLPAYNQGTTNNQSVNIRVFSLTTIV